MALDPLKFAVQITDEATQELKNIKTLIDGLQDKSVNISVSGNLGELLTFLKDGVDASKFDNLKSSISEALSGLDGLNRAAKEGNFTEYAGQINTAKDAVVALANAISAVDAVVGSNEGFQKFMVSIGEVVTRVDAALKQLNESSNANGGVMGSKSIEKAKYELYQFDNLVKQAEQTSRLGKQFGDVDTTGLDTAIEKLKKYRAELDQIAQTGKGEKGRGFDKFAMQAEYKEAVDQVKKLSAEQNTAEISLARYNQTLKETNELQQRLSNAFGRSLVSGAGTTDGIGDASDKIAEFKNRLKSLSEEDQKNSQIVNQLTSEFQRLKPSVTAAAKEQERLNTATEKANKKSADDAVKKQQRDNERLAESMRVAGNEATSLEIKIRKLKDTEAKSAAVGVDTSELKNYISMLERYANVMRDIQQGYNRANAGDILSGKTMFGTHTLPDVKKLADESERLTNEKRKTASAASQLTAEEQRLAQALNHTAESAKGQSQVLSDLKSMAMQYLGVWGGQQFLHNIIEIGGQLEMQRMSIGAILQNQSQANDLFEKIKGLAVQSPFGVVELDQMTKQLTAYGFKYSELFDMTKRLADISAATGTGVDRLALALGHVRSEAALSGYTLRQFSMGNVPLLQKLSEKLGKTTQEIRKMVRSKEISYEDVEGVIKDLTNEGGMFYNMQETISQSVKARFKNVKDAMAIMYGEMAESGMGDALKSVADSLMEITKNWKDVATVMGTGVALWAANRAAIMTYTVAIGKNNAAVLSTIASHKAHEAQVLRLAWVYRERTAQEMQAISTSTRMTALERLRAMLTGHVTKAQRERMAVARQEIIIGNALAVSQGKLTAEDIAKQVATARLTKTEARRIIILSDLSAAEKEAALNAIAGVRTYGRFTGVVNGAAIAAQRLGVALKSLIFNPAMLGMAAIAGIVELWQRNNQEMERAKELGDAIFEASQEGLKNARIMMKETGINAYQSRNGELVNLTESFGAEIEGKSKTFLVKPEFDPSTAEQIIEQWSQYIRDYAGTPNQILNHALKDEAGNVRMLKDQFDELFKSVESVVNAQKGLVDMAGMFESAQESTGEGAFNEDLVKDIKDYDGALKSFHKSIVKTFKDYGRSVKSGIDAARRFDKGFAQATEGMSSYGEMLKLLVNNHKDYSEAVSRFKSEQDDLSLWENLLEDNKGVGRTHKEMSKEFTTFVDDIRAALVAAGKDIDNLDFETQQGLMEMFVTKFISSLGNISEETRKELVQKFAEAFNMSIDEAEEVTEKRLADWQKRADNVFEINKTIKVKTKTITSLDEFAQAVQKDLKEKQEYITRNAGHIRQVLTISTSLKLDTKTLNEQIIALSTQVQVLVARGQMEAARALNSKIQDELIPFRDALASVEEDRKWLKQEGYPEEDPTKNKSKNKKNTGSKEDKNAKAVRERVRILKEAADAFEYWNKKLGPTGAWERVNEQFGDVLSKIGVTIDNIEDLRGHLKAVANSKEYKAIKDQKVKLEIDKEIAKDLDQLNRKVFEKSIEEYKSKFTKMLDDLTRRWETFNTVRQATGNKALAFELAGISEQDRDMRNAADALRKKLIEEMRNAGGEDLVVSIPLDVYVDEEKLRDQFKSALGDNDEQAMKIDGLVEAYKRWQKAQQDVTKADIDAYAKIIGSTVDYASRIDRINDKLEQEKESIKALVDLYSKSGGKEGISQDDADIANAILMAKSNFDKLKEGSDYINLMNRSLSMTKGEITSAAAAIEDSLNERLAAGVIKAEEYAAEMKKLHDIVTQFDENSMFGDNSALASFLRGGLKGGQSFVNDRIVSLTIKSNQEGLSKEEQDELDGLINLRKKLDGVVARLNSFSVAIQIVTGTLEGFKNAALSLSEMFDAIGNEGAANFWSDVTDVIGGVTAIFEPINNALQSALSGNVSGLVSSALSAPVSMITGPIKSFSQLHDKRLERAIERLHDDVKAIESNTELIAKSRERTLGYDMGDVRRQMAQQYAQQSYGGSGIMAYVNAMFNGSRQNKSMYEYYSKNSQGTGYQQEYDNLVEQREKYMEILKDQQSKKKKSNEEIDETKSKIAELDDQIAYFTQDLAKELWSIDIKGWADQLSDALASAFENGENMAKAYRDTVTQIIQQMMQKMMQMAILEPMFERLQKQLFGENGKGGVFDPNNPKGSMSKVTAMIGDFFGKGGEGEKAITASMEFMTAFQRGMQNAGLTVLNEASNTLSSSMQGTTEETSGLLAGYVNALRQDVSANRILLNQFVAQYWPDYMETFASQVTAVQNIDSNVQVIMTMMQMGNGALYEQIAAMRTRIDNVVMGIDRFSIR